MLSFIHSVQPTFTTVETTLILSFIYLYIYGSCRSIVLWLYFSRVLSYYFVNYLLSMTLW